MGNKFLIVGNPNTGKTSLFNCITKSHEKTANYSGVTVQEKVKSVYYNGKYLEFVDLPGIYSLTSVSDDERVTAEYLKNNKDTPILFVCSSEDIKKNMILLTDLINNKHKVMVVVNKIGKKIDTDILENISKNLKIPILQTDVRKKKNEILDWISSAIASRVNEVVDLNKILSLLPKDKKTIEMLDKVLLHSFWGKLIFFIVFIAVILISYGNIGTGLSAYVEHYVLKGGRFVSNEIEKLNLVWLQSFWESVVIGAVGTVVVYLPQLALMLTLLFILEEMGYLPRVASLFNNSFEKFGMNGKSIFSLIMGVGCTTSAMLVTRNIGSNNARISTARLLPFIGCSAKLPIMVFITQVLMGSINFFDILMIYLASFVVGLCYVFFCADRENTQKYFISEVPRFKIPNLKYSIKQSIVIVFDLFKKIVGTVFLSTCVLWILLNLTPSLEFFSGEKSILEYLSDYVSVVFYPLGLNRTDVVISLFMGFLAKENIVSAMGMFGSIHTLTNVQALTFLIFIMLYSPCIPSLKCTKCEFGKKFALKMFFNQTIIAYLSAFVFSTFAKITIVLGFVMIIVFCVLLMFCSLVFKNKEKFCQKNV